MLSNKEARLLEAGDRVPFGKTVARVTKVEVVMRVGFGRVARIHFDRGYSVDWALAQDVTVEVPS